MSKSRDDEDNISRDVLLESWQDFLDGVRD